MQNPEHQSPSKGNENNENNENNATLSERKDGSFQLVYSTKNDIEYKLLASYPNKERGISLS